MEPTSSTIPMHSWPRMSPFRIAGMEAWYRWRSEPQMVVLVTLPMASWAWPMAGRGTSSTATFPTPFHTRAFMASCL